MAEKLYPLANFPNQEDYDALGLKRAIFPKSHRSLGIMAVSTGEKRLPKRGEWYLSGAIIEAWRAPNDLSQPFYIARLVETEKVTVIKKEGSRKKVE